MDTVWVLERVAEDHPALGIDDPLDGRGVSEPSDPAGRLVDPGVPPGPPLAQGSTPDAQLLRDFGAAFRPPGPEATAALDRFTAQPDLEGYALAHQWLALIWAEELGHRLPPDVLAREQRIEAQVRAELAEHPELPIDLWAELTALLAQHGGGLDEAARQQALCRVVGTAEAEGVWRGDGTYAQRYAGGSFDITAEPEHVTALMTWLLAALVRPA
ncbi:MAG TPA: hypothetical protein VHK88_05785 [Aquihabitans sp.]|nr:hypothetical protein [Aquihabitans sp.]